MEPPSHSSEVVEATLEAAKPVPEEIKPELPEVEPEEAEAEEEEVPAEEELELQSVNCHSHQRMAPRNP